MRQKGSGENRISGRHKNREARVTGLLFAAPVGGAREGGTKPAPAGCAQHSGTGPV